MLYEGILQSSDRRTCGRSPTPSAWFFLSQISSSCMPPFHNLESDWTALGSSSFLLPARLKGIWFRVLDAFGIHGLSPLLPAVPFLIFDYIILRGHTYFNWHNSQNTWAHISLFLFILYVDTCIYICYNIIVRWRRSALIQGSHLCIEGGSKNDRRKKEDI